jgi:hypothetical protein
MFTGIGTEYLIPKGCYVKIVDSREFAAEERTVGFAVDEMTKRAAESMGGSRNPDDFGPWDFELDDLFDAKSYAGSWVTISHGEYQFLKQCLSEGRQLWYTLYKQLGGGRIRFDGIFDAVKHFKRIELSNYKTQSGQPKYRLSASAARELVERE